MLLSRAKYYENELIMLCQKEGPKEVRLFPRPLSRFRFWPSCGAAVRSLTTANIRLRIPSSPDFLPNPAALHRRHGLARLAAKRVREFRHIHHDSAHPQL